MIGSNSTVTIEHLTQTKDAHGGKVDGEADPEQTTVEQAMISRASLGNLWRITVSGNYGDIGKAPSEWRITDATGRTFAPTRATYRPPAGRIATSEHTLLFAELQGEVDTGVEV